MVRRARCAKRVVGPGADRLTRPEYACRHEQPVRHHRCECHRLLQGRVWPRGGGEAHPRRDRTGGDPVLDDHHACASPPRAARLRRALVGRVYGTNVVCLNPEHILEFAEAGGRDLLASRYTIGAWCWEGSRFPPSLHGAFRLVDEIWVASEFVAGLISAETEKPVLRFPMPVEVRDPPTLSRKDLGLPDDRFVFLFVYDFFSTLERKNPLGLIEAFKRAFPPGSGPMLVLKSINGRKKREELAARAGGRRHAPRHPRRGRVRRGGAGARVDGPLRLLRLAPPQRGLRPHDRRRDGVRKARDSDPLLGQLDLHARRQQLPRRCRPRDGAAGHPELPGGKRMGGPESGRGGCADAASGREPGRSSRACRARTADHPRRAFPRPNG